MLRMSIVEIHPISRFAILGNSGSGKSTLAATLASRYMAPCLDLDTVAWQPGTVGVPRAPAEAVAEVQRFCAVNHSFVIEGCYENLIAAAFPYSPRLVFLDIDLEVCERHCRARPYEPHKYATAVAQNERLEYLLAWLRNYYTRSGPVSHVEHVKLFESYSGPKIRLSQELMVDKAVQTLML